MHLSNIPWIALSLVAICSCAHHHGATDAQHVPAAEGRRYDMFGVKLTLKVMSHDTGGEYSVLLTETPPQGGPPLHVHSQEDELFYVVEGQYEFRCEAQTILARTGDLVRLPRGLPHAFKNVGTAPGLTLNTITPGGFEAFFIEVAEAGQQGRPSRSRLKAIAEKYGVTFVRSSTPE